MAVWYSVCCLSSAAIVSSVPDREHEASTGSVDLQVGGSQVRVAVQLRGRPKAEPGEKLCVTPVRSPSRPVSRLARDGVQTDAPAWKSVRRMPEAASASM